MTAPSIPECRYDPQTRFYIIACRACPKTFRVRPEHKRRRYCSDACYARGHPQRTPRCPRWSHAEIKQLRALAGTISSRDLAARIGRPYAATLKKAQALGIPLRRIGENHPYVRYTDAQVEAARSLADEGMTAKQIAVQMGIPHSTVEGWIQYRARLGHTPKVW